MSRYGPNLILLAVVSTLCLVVAELSLSLISPEAIIFRSFNEGRILLPYDPNSEADLVTEEYRVRYRINRFGMRDRAGSTQTPARGVRRIVLLGDSFAEGFGVEQDATFGARIESATGIEVLNAGQNGGCPLLYLYQARDAIHRFAPDVILLQIFDNDFQDNVRIGQILALDPLLPPRVLPGPDPWALRSKVERIVRRRELYQGLRRLKMRLVEGKTIGPWFYKVGRGPKVILSRAQMIRKYGV